MAWGKYGLCAALLLCLWVTGCSACRQLQAAAHHHLVGLRAGGCRRGLREGNRHPRRAHVCRTTRRSSPSCTPPAARASTSRSPPWTALPACSGSSACTSPSICRRSTWSSSGPRSSRSHKRPRRSMASCMPCRTCGAPRAWSSTTSTRRFPTTPTCAARSSKARPPCGCAARP